MGSRSSSRGPLNLVLKDGYGAVGENVLKFFSTAVLRRQPRVHMLRFQINNAAIMTGTGRTISISTQSFFWRGRGAA